MVEFAWNLGFRFFYHAPVVQRIERGTPKPEIEVQFLSGAPSPAHHNLRSRSYK